MKSWFADKMKVFSHVLMPSSLHCVIARNAWEYPLTAAEIVDDLRECIDKWPTFLGASAESQRITFFTQVFMPYHSEIHTRGVNFIVL